MLTNDVAALAPGDGCPALLLTIQGRVTADVRVARARRTRSCSTSTCACARRRCVEALEKLIIADDVELGDPAVAAGARSASRARRPRRCSAPAPSPALAPMAHARSRSAASPCARRARARCAGRGSSCTCRRTGAAAVWDALVARRCPAVRHGRRSRGGGSRWACRASALDMDGSTLALEVPVEDAISATKGCYLGQEVVARGTARGHVNRRLVGLRLEGPEPPPGRAARARRQGGRAAHLGRPRLRRAAALAALGFVRREHWEPGTELAVRHGHAVTLARVAALPLA